MLSQHELYGHADIIRSFCSLADTHALSHAYMFYGDNGVGKGTFARWFANYLETKEFNVPTNMLVDAMVVTVPEESSRIGIESVRALERFLWHTPLRSFYRCGIIDDAHLLTPDAQSALLKLVEDAPRHALLIFIAHSDTTLLAPLLSRLSKVYFRRLTREAIEKILITSSEISTARAKQIATSAFGRIGRARMLAEGKAPETKSFADEIEERVVVLWQKNAAQYASRIKWLLARVAAVRRYNVHEPLQRRAVTYYTMNT